MWGFKFDPQLEQNVFHLIFFNCHFLQVGIFTSKGLKWDKMKNLFYSKMLPSQLPSQWDGS